MKKVFLTIMMLLMSFSISLAFGKDMQGCGSDCKACHKITKDDARSILSAIDPNVEVESAEHSHVRGLFEVILKKDGKASVVYLDYSKKNLILGRVIDLKEKKDVTKETIDEHSSIDVSKISTKNALVMGNKQGKKKMYIFSDPECPFCTKLHDQVLELLKEEPQLKVYIILFALPMHKDAGWKTQSIVCESKKDMDKAIKMLEDSYHGRPVEKLDCGKVNYADENKKMAAKLGVGATPTVVFQNGKVVMGAVGKEELKKYLNKQK